MYFRMVTLVAFHAFIDLKVSNSFRRYSSSTIATHQVDATILEVGVGGMYDCTNIVPKPIVTGISALGIDHVNVLGKTIPEIAWQKGGIYKVSGLLLSICYLTCCTRFNVYSMVLSCTILLEQEGVPAFTVNQPKEGLEVLEKQALDRKASSFAVVPEISGLQDVKLGTHFCHLQS